MPEQRNSIHQVWVSNALPLFQIEWVPSHRIGSPATRTWLGRTRTPRRGRTVHRMRFRMRQRRHPKPSSPGPSKVPRLRKPRQVHLQASPRSLAAQQVMAPTMPVAQGRHRSMRDHSREHREHRERANRRTRVNPSRANQHPVVVSRSNSRRRRRAMRGTVRPHPPVSRSWPSADQRRRTPLTSTSLHRHRVLRQASVSASLCHQTFAVRSPKRRDRHQHRYPFAAERLSMPRHGHSRQMPLLALA